MIDPQRAGEEANNVAEADRSFWRWVRSPREPKAEPPVPEPGSQEEINALERQIALKQGELDQLVQETRFDALERELRSGKLMGKTLVSVTQFVTGWRPAVERMRAEFQELKQRHAELVKRRREQERRSASCAV
jgi:hypothetical protein